MILPTRKLASRLRPDPFLREGERRRARAVGLLLGRLRGAGLVATASAPPFGAAAAASARPGDPLEDLAYRLDAAAVRFAKGQGAIDLAIGEALDALFTDDRYRALGSNRQVDYIRERLGIPVRTAYDYRDLARAVADLPDLRLAVIRGDVVPGKARLVAPAIRKEPARRQFLLHVASTRTEEEIRQILADLGQEVPADPFVCLAMRFVMSREMQEHLDAAIELAKPVAGHARPPWVYIESIAMEFLAAHPELVPEPAPLKPPPPPPHAAPPSPAERKRLLAEWESRDTREIAKALRFLLAARDEVLRGKPIRTEDPAELEDLVLELLSFRARWDEPFGRILETISTLRLYTYVGYPSFARYARERLGISERKARQRVWLERRMGALPVLRMALVTGRLTYSKALEVAADATKENVAERIRKAAATTWQQTRRERDAREHRQNLAAGIRRIWGPDFALETVAAAIRVAKDVFFREKGVRIGDGEALGLVAAHFEDEWRDPVRRGRLPPLKRKVLARTKGVCATPECGNPAEHMHHIVFRSDRGPDEEWNCTYLCFTCHRRIHVRGTLKVRGRAGERLLWRIFRGRGSWELWETANDDDVRFLREDAPLP